MGLIYDQRDEREQIYTEKFLSLAASHGISIKYTIDRAALDAGLHLTAPLDSSLKSVTDKRVWFQFKGKEDSAGGLTKEKFDQTGNISQSVKVEHLRQWYRYAEPVYLAVYVQAVDKFFAVDIKKVIDERWGDSIFKDETFFDEKGVPQKSVTIYLPKASEVNDAFWQQLSAHRSMRIDGAFYQGRPLPHDHDFQSRIPRIMDPALFDEVVGELLIGHRYRITGWGDLDRIYPAASSAGDKVSLSVGKLYDPYQYDLYLTREILPDEDGYREDGQTIKVQGSCAVIIHSLVRSRPSRQGLEELAKELAANGTNNLIVFVNHYMTSVGEIDGKEAYNCFPEYSQAFRGSGVHCVPQHLEDLGKTISLATNIYMNFRERIAWLDEVLEMKVKNGEVRIITPEEYFSDGS